MFYSETILSRRGPLGRVWLAAHMERKLSKSQTLQTDIEQSVDAIMGQEIEVMALRLSGQLLLGVVRIYSRKAKYLLDDCNEALLKIKMAFRPGVVDLTEDQLTVNKTAITLQTNGLALDHLLPDVDWDMDFEDRPLGGHGQHQARLTDITLASDVYQYGVEDPFDIDTQGDIDLQDLNGVTVGIHWGDEQNDKSDIEGSIGVGRDVENHTFDMGDDLGIDVNIDLLSHESKSRDPSEQPFASPMDVDAFPSVDLGNLGIGFDEIPLQQNGRNPSQSRSFSRTSSPLTEIPTTPTYQPLINSDKDKLKKRFKDRKQIIDSVTELNNGASLTNNRGRAGGNPLHPDTSNIISKYHSLPRSSIVLRLLEIRNDPLTYFLPTKAKNDGSFSLVAPPELTQALAELFLRPSDFDSRPKRKGDYSPDASPVKRPRQEEVEIPRQISNNVPRNEGVALNPPTFDGNDTFEFGESTMEDHQPDEIEFGVDLDESRKSILTNNSRLSSLDPEEHEENGPYSVDLTCPVSIFDVSQTLQDAQETDNDQVLEKDEHGYSKNTLKALGLIRKELHPYAKNQVDKVMSFKKVSSKASRRAAASFFFELLVLGTRDCLGISQQAPFADIEVSAKHRLWEHQHHEEMEKI